MKLKDIKSELSVKEIDKKDTIDIIENKHYLRRKPPMSFAYGLFLKGELVGIITIGKPASNNLCIGVAGKDLAKYVYELNRMFVYDYMPRNTGSYFLGKVLKMIKHKNMLLVSYSDTGMHHQGYIYQATNWYYTGHSAKRTDTYNPKGTHPRDYKPEKEYAHLRRVRSVKNRYVYFCADKKHKKLFMDNLKYPIIHEYPKGQNENYIVGEAKPRTLIWNKKTDEYYYE